MKITHLYVHPVKSCQPILVSSIQVGEFGFVNDRRWMVLNSENRYQGLKHNPRLNLVSVSLDEKHLKLNAEGMPTLTIPIVSDNDETRTPFKVEIFKATVDVIDEGEEASKWLTEFLLEEKDREMKRLRLVRNFTVNCKRPAESKLDGADSVVMLADAFPVLLASQSSIDFLNSKLREQNKVPIQITRFRPNIVVDGPEAYPHIEDDWQQIKAGEVDFTIAEQCVRCKVPTATENGSYDPDNEPTNTLKQYRSIKNMVFFGNYFFHTKRGMLKIGDEVQVVKSAPWMAIKNAQN